MIDQDLLDDIEAILDFKDNEGEPVSYSLEDVVWNHWQTYTSLFAPCGRDDGTDCGCLTQVKSGILNVSGFGEGEEYNLLQRRIKNSTTIASDASEILPKKYRNRKTLTKKMRSAVRKILMNYARWQMKVRKVYGIEA